MEDSVPFYIGADKPEIKACLDAGNEIRGVDGKPFTMGGGTMPVILRMQSALGLRFRLSRFLILWVRYIPLMRESALTALRCP